MPYHVAKSSNCPASKPWACIKSADGKIMGCHADKDSAMQQMKALYVNDPHAKDSFEPQKEVRFFEIRTSIDADKRSVIEGHAAVFNQPSLEIFLGMPGWREIIRPGAFSQAIKTDDVRALINHNSEKLIGRVSNGTLGLEEDATGLAVRIYPPETSDARDVLALIRGRYITQMSFGFTVGEDGERIDQANKFREILQVKKLYDVSPVTEPAYPQTDVGLRSRIEANLLPPINFSENSERRKQILANAQAILSKKKEFSYVINSR